MKVSLFYTVQVSRLALAAEDCLEEETLQSRESTPSTTVFRMPWVECGLDSDVGDQQINPRRSSSSQRGNSSVNRRTVSSSVKTGKEPTLRS